MKKKNLWVRAGLLGMAAALTVTIVISRETDSAENDKAVSQFLEIEYARWSMENPHAAAAERRQGIEFQKTDAAVSFAILHPEEANAERRKDPALALLQDEAAYAILNADKIEADRRKLPEWSQREEQALRSLRGE